MAERPAPETTAIPIRLQHETSLTQNEELYTLCIYVYYDNGEVLYETGLLPASSFK